MERDRKRAALAVAAGRFSGVVRGGGGSGGGCDRWGRLEGMSAEVMALVFGRMPTDVMARTVPFVCRAWKDAAKYSLCWSNIELEEWCRRVDRTDVIDAAVRRLVRRSQGTLQRLSVYHLGNSLSHVADLSGKTLTELQIPMSDVTDRMVENFARSLPNLSALNISACSKISSKGIELFGKNCKSLIQLKRNINPVDYELHSIVDESEALAIASTMPKLELLDLAYGRFSDHGLEAILTKCPALQTLDIQGCFNVKMSPRVEQLSLKVLSFTEPWANEFDINSDDE